MALAPPEYLVIRKVAFYREGAWTKHLEDLCQIRQVTQRDEAAPKTWLSERQRYVLRDLGKGIDEVPAEGSLIELEGETTELDKEQKLSENKRTSSHDRKLGTARPFWIAVHRREWPWQMQRPSTRKSPTRSIRST